MALWNLTPACFLHLTWSAFLWLTTTVQLPWSFHSSSLLFSGLCTCCYFWLKCMLSCFALGLAPSLLLVKSQVIPSDKPPLITLPKVGIFFKSLITGLPWWRSGWESACQCGGHGFGPWSGRIPHAAERLGPWATTAEPARLEPVLRNGGGRDGEGPRAPRWRVAPACRNWRGPSHRNEDPTQPKIN